MASKLTSELLTDAKSIADLQQTNFVTYQDILSALNEAYRDIYNQYTESDGDYFVQTAVFSMSEMTVIPDTNGYQFEIPLPTDFYKVRAVGYNAGGQWFDVKTFSISDRNNPTPDPQYRIRNNTLWLKCISQFQIKLEYYIPPVELTTPDESLSFFTTISDFAKSSLRDVSFVDLNQSAIYASGNDVKALSLVSGGTEVTLVTSVTPSKPVYYRGYVYYISAGNVWRMPTDLVTGLAAAAQIITDGTITDLSVFDNKIYFRNSTQAKSANLD